MTHWMFNCSEVSKKVSQSMDTSLPLSHRLAIRMHVMMCRHCARFRGQLFLLRYLSLQDGTKDLPPEAPEGLSAEARERIKSSLRNRT